MTVSLPVFPTRGARNPDTRATNGREAIFTLLESAINALTISGVAAETFFSAAAPSSAANIALTAVANLIEATLTTSGKYLRFDDATAESTMFDGGRYVVRNAGGTHSFELQDNAAGSLLSAIAPGEAIEAMLTADGTAAGTWQLYELLRIVSNVAQLYRNLNCNDKVIQRAEFQDYSETLVTANSGASYGINLESGNNFEITLTNNATFSVSNPPASGKAGGFALKTIQDGTGGRSITWFSGIKWVSGSAPSISTAIGKKDRFVFLTNDGGSTWDGLVSGLDLR